MNNKKLPKIKPTQFTFSEGSKITNENTSEVWKSAFIFKNFRFKVSNSQWRQIAKNLNILNNIIAKNPVIKNQIIDLFQSQKPNQKIVNNLNEIVINNYDEIQELTKPLQEMSKYLNLWKKIKEYQNNSNVNLTTEEWNLYYDEYAQQGNIIQEEILGLFKKEDYQKWLDNQGFSNDWTITFK